MPDRRGAGAVAAEAIGICGEAAEDRRDTADPGAADRIEPEPHPGAWGAIVATAALVWNIIRSLRSGAIIKVSATPNMQIFPPQPPYGDKTYISVTAINRGNAPTTITNFVGYHAEDFISAFLERCILLLGLGGIKLFKKLLKVRYFVINTVGGLSKALPCVLNAGEEWIGMVDQEQTIKDGYLYIGVCHNQRRRPIYVRVKLKPKNK